jgi:hypothetical protein
MFHLTRGGISKATKATNLSEDVFAGKHLLLLKKYSCHLLLLKKYSFDKRWYKQEVV